MTGQGSPGIADTWHQDRLIDWQQEAAFDAAIARALYNLGDTEGARDWQRMARDEYACTRYEYAVRDRRIR